MVVVLTVITGLAYPLAITGVAQVVFPGQADGSLIATPTATSSAPSSSARSSATRQYFCGRPSAAGDGYDAAASGGSNLGPTSQKLRDLVTERAAALREANGLAADAEVPAEPSRPPPAASTRTSRRKRPLPGGARGRGARPDRGPGAAT